MNRCQNYCKVIKRLCITANEGLLPAAYQQVEYLESTGSQYIETGIVPTAGGKTVVEHQFTGQQLQLPDNTVFYIDNGAAENNAYGFSTAYYSHVKGYVCGWSSYSVIPYTSTTQNTITITAGVFELNGNVIVTKTGTYYWDKSIKLFAWNRNGNIVVYGKVKVYRFTYYTSASDSKPAHDYIPCYRKSDNKTGMYDLITKTFLTNSGTGEFTLGPNVEILPPGYT